MPLFVHAMTGALGVHGLAVELPGEADGEVTDVDHLLHLAMSFRANLAHFQADQVAQRLLVFAQHVTQIADQFAASGGRHAAPIIESGLGGGDDLVVLSGAGLEDGGDRLAGGGIVGDELFAGGAANPAARARAGPGVNRLDTQMV